MTLTRRLRPVTILTLLLTGGRLVAQRPDSTTRVDTTPQFATRRHVLPTVIVTGSLAARSSEKLGVTRSVMDQSALRAEPSRAAVDPLRHTTGIFVDEANGPLGPTIIRLRGGEETFSQVLIDGVQGNENGGFFDWQGLTLVNVDRVELARGPQSAVYGSSAMSGVVQIFTREGEPGRSRVEATLEGGRTAASAGNARGIVEASGGSERLRYSAGIGSAYDRGPYRLPHDLKSNDASARLDLLASGPFQLTAVGRFMGVDSKLPVRDAGTTRAPLDPNQRNERDRVIASIQAAWAPSERWTHRLTASEYRQDFTYIDRKDGLDPSQYQFFVFDANLDFHALVNRQTVRYVGTLIGEPSAPLAFTMSYGGQWEHESVKNALTGDFGPSSQSVSRPSIAGFVEGQARIGDRLSLLAGSRVEQYRGIDPAIVPRATAVFDLVPQRLALRAAAGRAYKAPNIQDQFPNNPFIVGNPDLSPETSTSWELGTDVTLSRTTGSLTVFRQSYDNLIRSVNYDASGRQINRNLGRSRASGLEAEVAVHPRPRLSFGASGSWTMTKVLDNRGLPSDQFPNGEGLPFRPTHTATAFVELPATRSISVLFRATSVGRQTVLTERFSGERRSVGPYSVISASGTFTLSRWLEAYLHAQNVLNEHYETGFDRPGAPRSAAAGLRVRR